MALPLFSDSKLCFFLFLPVRIRSFCKLLSHLCLIYYSQLQWLPLLSPDFPSNIPNCLLDIPHWMSYSFNTTFLNWMHCPHQPWLSWPVLFSSVSPFPKAENYGTTFGFLSFLLLLSPAYLWTLVPSPLCPTLTPIIDFYYSSSGLLQVPKLFWPQNIPLAAMRLSFIKNHVDALSGFPKPAKWSLNA